MGAFGMTSDGSSAVTTPFRVVLMDDNAHDREHFRNLIRRHPAIQLTGEAETFQEALKIVMQENADILVLESRIGGYSVLEDCPLIPSLVKIIFLTQHPDAAVMAFELDAVDFLLKPLTSSRLAETMRRLLRLDWPRPSAAAPLPTGKETLLIPFERGRRGVRLDEISMIQAFGNYTRVAMGEGRSEIVLRSLAKWEKVIPMPPFLRVHRNTIVNSAKVSGLEQMGSASVLRLTEIEEPVAVSRRCLADVRQILFSSPS